MNDTVIVVGITRKDQYDNLWVTPAGGGDEVKIGSKRAQLHDIFQQGRAVMCHWEVYMDKPYIADAKLVEGELPTEPGKPLPEHQAEISKAMGEVYKPAGVEIGKCENQVIYLYCAGKLSSMFGDKIAIELVKLVRGSILATLKPPYEGKDLPQFKPKTDP